ncbi:MAG: hypothetical protein IJ087_00150 [Eggerthellaceae bacterium]|nr:hypothetical protein [Eggerthellaceae bacterium]
MKIREGETLRDFMLRCALHNDTSMARAFLRALGVPVPDIYPRIAVIEKVDKFAGLDDCMSQRYGVRM